MLNRLNEEFESRKNQILNSESQYTISGNVYYVSSSSGNDENDGLSPESAWKTLEKVSEHELCHGDCVLFKRGDLFRGCVYTKPNVTYSV